MNRPLRNCVRFIVLSTLYLLGAALAVGFLGRPDQVALVWAPAGLGFAALLVYGIRWWPFIVVGMALTHLTLVRVPATFLPFSIGADVLATVAGAYVVRRYLPAWIGKLSIRSGFALLVGGVVLILVSAPIGVFGLLFAGMISPAQFLPSMARWMMGDLFGVIVVTPTAMMLMVRLRDGATHLPVWYAGWAEKSIWLVCIVTSLFLLWLDTHSPGSALAMASLPLALVLWSALRFEPLPASFANMVLALVIASFVGMGWGGLAMPQSLLDSTTLVLFMATLSIMPQLLVAVTHQNRVDSLRLLRRATRDPLTRLPNRAAFERQVRELIEVAPHGSPMTLACVDVDQFKVINDVASHAAGDEFVRVLAGALGSHLNPGELLARLSGDEFGIFLPNCEPAEARRRLEFLREQVSELNVPWQEHVLSTSISIGLVQFMAAGQAFDRLLAHADAACFTAKELGGNRIQAGSANENENAPEVHLRTTAMHWAMRLNAALEHGHFKLYCQSISPLHASAGRRHFEVLLRMQDVESGELLMPAIFIHAAERFNLGARLDRYVVEHTLAWLESHPAEAAGVGLCSINLSAASVNSDDFERFLRKRIAASPLAPAQLCFELTETSAVRDLARAQRFIQSVRTLGCRFALDDFGTGFCSFAYLQALDVDYFKIDGSFVSRIADSPLSLAIVRSIAEIARVMHKQTIAEYVESPAIRARLVELDVDYAQGYAIDEPQPIDAYFAKPMPSFPAAATSHSEVAAVVPRA